MIKYRNKFRFLLFCFLVLAFAGCATIPQEAPTVKPQAKQQGTYHKVEKGQTLWKISKMYNISLDELVNTNHISDDASLETGQILFIPEKYSKTNNFTNNIPDEDFAWPIQGKVVAIFGQTVDNIMNKGINIQPLADANVTASRSGKVIFYDPDFLNFGKTIILDHGNGFTTIYSRNAQVFVKPGDTVQKGSLIAKAGKTDRDKNIYLHFEIRKGPSPQNPYFYLSRQ